MGHVGQSLVLRRALPGLGGGIAVLLPYSVAVLTRLWRRGCLDVERLGRDTGTGLALLSPGIIGVRLLVRRLG